VFPRPCAEFPNDNPVLYEVLASACIDLSGTPTEAPAESEEPLELAELGDPPCEESTPMVPEAVEPSSDPFTNLVAVLEGVARDAGAADGVGKILRGLLGMDRLDAAGLPEASIEALMAGALLERTSTGPRRSEAFTQIVRAWQGILRGESDDFAMCGPATLDDWSADVLARVLGNAMLATQLRRELRQRGVAAFGLVARAA
jgi:hypothetical protein